MTEENRNGRAEERQRGTVCRTGDWSEEVTEILTDRGYDAYNVEGGFKAYAARVQEAPPIKIDAKGLKCPGPIVKVADTLRGLKTGQKVFAQATEDAFASDIAVWCDRTGNRLLKLEVKPEIIEATFLGSGEQSDMSLFI